MNLHSLIAGAHSTRAQCVYSRAGAEDTATTSSDPSALRTRHDMPLNADSTACGPKSL
jgi:hypothetical protein